MTKARDIASAIPAPSTVSSVELGYLDGVTSAIQTQIDAKIGSASAINPTIVDAKGDIIAATAADTVARLAVGANGTVLTAASGQATGLQWATPSAGGMTSIASGSLSGASVVLSGIPATYNQIFLELKNCHPTANGYSVQVTVTGQTSGYVGVKLINSNGTISTGAQPTAEITGFILEAIKNDANEYAYGSVLCTNYADTTAKKFFQVQGTVKQYTNTFLRGWAVSELNYPTSAISSLTIETSGTTFAGGTYVLWGIK